jgi:hypothetical protein
MDRFGSGERREREREREKGNENENESGRKTKRERDLLSSPFRLYPFSIAIAVTNAFAT